MAQGNVAPGGAAKLPTSAYKCRGPFPSAQNVLCLYCNMVATHTVARSLTAAEVTPEAKR